MQSDALRVASELQVKLLGLETRIDEQNEGAELLAFLQVTLEKPGPFLALGVAGPGVAVARQVHKTEVVGAHAVIVDGARFAGGGADLREGAPSRERVDEGGLSHVGAAGEGYLRDISVNELVYGIGRGFKDEFRFLHGILRVIWLDSVLLSVKLINSICHGPPAVGRGKFFSGGTRHVFYHRFPQRPQD